MAAPGEVERARRAARRAELRRTHPDLGGSPEAFRAAVAAERRDPAPVEFARARLRTAGRRVRG